MELVAANALGIGAASFASNSETKFGDGDEVIFDFRSETEA